MTKLPFSPRLCVLAIVPALLSACGGNRSLQSVNILPAAAVSKAQFTATGIYNKAPTVVDVTTNVAWCTGSTDGTCAGNIVQGATVNAGLAQCVPGFTGQVTILAGKSGVVVMPDTGFKLKPFGAAQLTCP